MTCPCTWACELSSFNKYSQLPSCTHVSFDPRLQRVVRKTVRELEVGGDVDSDEDAWCVYIRVRLGAARAAAAATAHFACLGKCTISRCATPALACAAFPRSHARVNRDRPYYERLEAEQAAAWVATSAQRRATQAAARARAAANSGADTLAPARAVAEEEFAAFTEDADLFRRGVEPCVLFHARKLGREIPGSSSGVGKPTAAASAKATAHPTRRRSSDLLLPSVVAAAPHTQQRQQRNAIGATHAGGRDLTAVDDDDGSEVIPPLGAAHPPPRSMPPGAGYAPGTFYNPLQQPTARDAYLMHRDDGVPSDDERPSTARGGASGSGGGRRRSVGTSGAVAGAAPQAEDDEGCDVYLRLSVGGVLQPRGLRARVESTLAPPPRGTHARCCRLCAPSLLEATGATYGRKGGWGDSTGAAATATATTASVTFKAEARGASRRTSSGGSPRARSPATDDGAASPRAPPPLPQQQQQQAGDVPARPTAAASSAPVVLTPSFRVLSTHFLQTRRRAWGWGFPTARPYQVRYPPPVTRLPDGPGVAMMAAAMAMQPPPFLPYGFGGGMPTASGAGASFLSPGAYALAAQRQQQQQAQGNAFLNGGGASNMWSALPLPQQWPAMTAGQSMKRPPKLQITSSVGGGNFNFLPASPFAGAARARTAAPAASPTVIIGLEPYNASGNAGGFGVAPAAGAAAGNPRYNRLAKLSKQLGTALALDASLFESAAAAGASDAAAAVPSSHAAAAPAVSTSTAAPLKRARAPSPATGQHEYDADASADDEADARSGARQPRSGRAASLPPKSSSARSAGGGGVAASARGGHQLPKLQSLPAAASSPTHRSGSSRTPSPRGSAPAVAGYSAPVFPAVPSLRGFAPPLAPPPPPPDPTLDANGYNGAISAAFWSAYVGRKASINAHPDSIVTLLRLASSIAASSGSGAPTPVSASMGGRRRTPGWGPAAVAAAIAAPSVSSATLVATHGSFAAAAGGAAATPATASAASLYTADVVAAAAADYWPWEKWLIRRRPHYCETHAADGDAHAGVADADSDAMSPSSGPPVPGTTSDVGTLLNDVSPIVDGFTAATSPWAGLLLRSLADDRARLRLAARRDAAGSAAAASWARRAASSGLPTAARDGLKAAPKLKRGPTGASDAAAAAADAVGGPKRKKAKLQLDAAAVAAAAEAGIVLKPKSHKRGASAAASAAVAQYVRQHGIPATTPMGPRAAAAATAAAAKSKGGPRGRNEIIAERRAAAIYSAAAAAAAATGSPPPPPPGRRLDGGLKASGRSVLPLLMPLPPVPLPALPVPPAAADAPFNPAVLGVQVDVRDSTGQWWLAQVVDVRVGGGAALTTSSIGEQAPAERGHKNRKKPRAATAAAAAPAAAAAAAASQAVAASSGGDDSRPYIRVHYAGWSEGYDEWIAVPPPDILEHVAVVSAMSAERHDERTAAKNIGRASISAEAARMAEVLAAAVPVRLRDAVMACRLAPAMTRSTVVSSSCAICFNKRGGALIYCDFPGCGRAYHSGCHVPSLHKVPVGKWNCMLHKLK